MGVEKENKFNKNTLSRQERLFKMKKLFLFVLALSVCVSAADDSLEERVGGLQAQIDRAMAKAGIHFSGEFRSQFLNSQVSGDAADPAGKKSESAEYTSVDFDIVARPNTALSARAIFRLHQDWRNFFSDVANPITTRWLSIDGSVGGGILKYAVGDYTKKLSPLTLWSPDIELLYEPEIFASARKIAMSEAFLGDNNRMMQGADISFRAELYPILNEVDADIFGARLATRGTYESAVIPPGVGGNPPTNYVASDFDKYLVGFNLGTQFVKGAGLALSNIMIFDYLESSRPDLDSTSSKLASQSTNVVAGRVNADNRAFMSDDFVGFGIQAEAALSFDKDYYLPDDQNIALDSTINGMAINAGLFVRLALGESNTVKFSADFIQNDTAFRNDAAQSPSFVQRQIFNNELGLGGLGLMNPFDALYRSVFKYAPSQYFGGARPYGKYSYNNAILPKDVIAGLYGHSQVYYPNVFQTALPGGMATADRTGPVVKLDGSFLDKAITVGAKAAMLNAFNEKDLSWKAWIDDGDLGHDEWFGVGAFKDEYQEIVGGASFDIAKFVPVLGPSLVIGGSYGMYNSKTGGFVSPERVYTSENASVLLSGELNYNFLPRFSFLVGYQQLTANIKSVENFGVNESESTENNYTFDNFAVGFGYKVADGGNLVVKLTMLSGQSEPVGGMAVKYEAIQPEVYLTVKF
jgi:hypothetical protein